MGALSKTRDALLCRSPDWTPHGDKLWRWHDGKWESREPTEDEMREMMSWWAIR
jgi:hypothetical protein